MGTWHPHSAPNLLMGNRLQSRRPALEPPSPGTIIGGCIADAIFEYVDGPIPGATLEILGNDRVLYQNEGDTLVDPDTFALFEPDDVKLRTRDGRIFHLDLQDGVTHLEDLHGNTLEITLDGITHSSGRGIEFVRDAEGRIETVVDPKGYENSYLYDDSTGDLLAHTDRVGEVTTFVYGPEHTFKTSSTPTASAPCAPSTTPTAE